MNMKKCDACGDDFDSGEIYWKRYCSVLCATRQHNKSALEKRKLKREQEKKWEKKNDK